MKKILGLDEAGRGPVIGPLVIAGVLIDEEELKDLAAIGVRDSKALSRSKREALLPKIEELACRTSSIIVQPQEMYENLNTIELKAMARIINELRPDEVYLDVPTNPRGIKKYCDLLRRLILDKSIKLVGENKADRKYIIVGAASILAKVQRDFIIKELREAYGDLGWGYPNEAKTQAFLKEWHNKHGEFPNFVRKKWKMVRDFRI